jgi:hypothetical protein
MTLFALVALIAAVLLQPAGAVPTGEQRVLVVLATSGARPYTVADVERTMHEADDFLRASSLGQVRLHVDVTPWLATFTGDPGCGATNRGLAAVVQPARFGADRAGYDTSHYDNVIYAIADSHCGFQGASFGHEVMLSRQPTVGLVVHSSATPSGWVTRRPRTARRPGSAAVSTTPATLSARWAVALSTSAPTRSSSSGGFDHSPTSTRPSTISSHPQRSKQGRRRRS